MSKPPFSLLSTGAFRPREPFNDPASSQTIEQVSAHYRSSKIGDVAVIRQTHGHVLNFRLSEIENIKGPRIYLKHSADFGGVAFYLKNGRNCRSPTGQASLVVPTPEVLAWIEGNPRGTMDWR